jgi:hypothetical protein
MKNLFLIILLILASFQALSQAPEKISYQAIIRNSSNQLLINQNIGMRVGVLQGSMTGSVMYSEIHNTTTNQNGLVSIEIGTGNVLTGTFASIDWANGPYYVQIETDPTGGTNYTLTSTSQLLSVPYALYAKTAGSSLPGPQGPQGPQGDNSSWVDNMDTTYTLDRIVVKGSSPNFYTVGSTSLPASISYSGNDAVPLIIKRLPNTAFNSSFSAQNINGAVLFGINQNAEACIGFNADQTNAVFRVIGSQSNPNGSIIIKPSSSEPINPTKGQIYFDNVLNKLRVWDGTTWQNCW